VIWKGDVLMRTNMMRVWMAVAAAAALSTLGVTDAAATGAPAQAPQQPPAAAAASAAAAVPGTQLWVKRYNGPGNGRDSAFSAAVSPGGRMVFVAGGSAGASSGEDYATIAYSATGAWRWGQRYSGPGNRDDFASSVAVSPDGRTVFVTGYSTGATSAQDYATIAYHAATGARSWVQRYNGPGNRGDFASSVAVSPDGRTVFVTGYSTGASSGEDYATIAYSAVTGKRLWVKRYNGSGNSGDEARAVKVSPDGRTVFVTGTSEGITSGSDYATIAYHAATGAQRWVKRYNGPFNFTDAANALAVSPDGRTVFVTGDAFVARTGPNYATVAYTAATGARRWVRLYTGSGLRSTALSVAVSPGGGKVFVTGASRGATTDFDYATVAYAATGAQRWVKRYNGPGNGFDAALQVAVSPDGVTVFITGESAGASSGPDCATIAYTAATGTRLWLQRYNGSGNSRDSATSIAVSPDGSRLFVTGESIGATSHEDYATIAYSG
jgi:WD40 repeat protein